MSPAAASPSAFPANALPPGTRLGEFELLAVLGIGGFGIVYRAMDHALEREVAIKEYMPAMLAGRTETMHVSLRSQSDAETFALGLRSFVNEAKLLARFDHPALLKVYRFWEQNDTAYMAMPIYHGRTLKALRQADGAPDEAGLRRLLLPLLGAIETLHAAGVYHRDIAPDNILVEADGRPVLLDFGAARRVLGDRSQTLTAILKPAYAPIEQYADVSAARQGPWTDLYALGATLHYVLVGVPPSPATARTLHDDLVPLAQRALPGCSPGFLRAIDWMLATRPADRPQSVAALRAVLDGQALPPLAPSPDPAAARAEGADGATVVDVSVPWPATDAGLERTLIERRPPPAGSTAAPASAPDGWRGDPATRRLLPLLAGLLVLAAAAAWWWSRPVAVTPVQLARPVPALPPAASAVTPSGALPLSTSAAVPPPAGARVASAAAATLHDPPLRERLADPPPMRQPAARTSTARRETVPVREPPVQPAPPSAADELPTASVIAMPPPASAPATAPAPIVTRVPVPAPATLSDEASALCGSRVLLALFWCMERKCASDEFKGHPACRKWFAANRQRQAP
jgi:hypothetical protein